MEYTRIACDAPREGVARITLTRADKANAQDKALLYQLDHALAAAARDDGVRCIVLAAEGDHFSSGHDLRDDSDLADFDAVTLWSGFGDDGEPTVSVRAPRQPTPLATGFVQHMSGGTRTWDAHGDYRARATRGVALAALALLLPFTLYALFRGLYVIVAGGTFIIALLVVNTWLVARGRDHQPATLFGLVPGGTLFMALAFRVDADIASVWCFPSILACYCMLSGGRARLANATILVVAVPAMWLTMSVVEAARLTASLVAVSLFASILVREIDAQQRKLRFRLDHDPLTGLLNRTSLKDRLQGAIDVFRRTLEPAALLTIDLDHFKHINDRFGHDTGDRVLCEVATLLRQGIGEGGAVFRTGGEEFLILLWAPGSGGAHSRAETLRAAVERSAILHGQVVTTSIGVATLRVSDDRESWTRRSDERLYAAKGAGRNRVVSADAGPVRAEWRAALPIG